MTTTSLKHRQLLASFQDKETRDLYVSEEIDTGLSFQVRATRRARGWSQRELAQRIGMAQGAISRLESPDYGKFTLTTLKRLASVFDVALIVRFAPFSHLVKWVADLSAEDVAVPDFDHDPGTHLDVHNVTAGTTSASFRLLGVFDSRKYVQPMHGNTAVDVPKPTVENTMAPFVYSQQGAQSAARSAYQ